MRLTSSTLVLPCIISSYIIFDIKYEIPTTVNTEIDEYEYDEDEIDFRLQNSYLEQGKIVRDRLIASL